MYISEIFNHLVRAGRPSNESNQVEDSGLPQGDTNITIPSNTFSRTVCLANYVA